MLHTIDPTPEDLERNLRTDFNEVMSFVNRDVSEPAFSIVASEVLESHYAAAVRRAIAAETIVSRVRTVLGAWQPEGKCRACGGNRTSGHQGICPVKEIERAITPR